jgi:putative ABC transport system permease protein
MEPRVAFEQLRQDARFAIRQWRRAPGFILVAIVTLALGVGANAAIFALADAALLRPLPFPDAERLVMVWEENRSTPRARVAGRDLIEWRDRTRSFAQWGAFVPSVGGMVMAGADGVAETVPRQWVTVGIFDVLGIQPVVGRTFTDADESARASVVVLSEAFWRTRFNSDPAILGQVVRLDGEPYTVLGVVPQEAQWIGKTSLWALAPLIRTPSRGPGALHVIARLQPGVTRDAAGAELAAAAAALAVESPATNGGRTAVLEPLRDAFIGRDLRRTALLLLCVVGVVLLICCANVANLLLTRASVRARELALRSALGAAHGRLLRQLLVEGALLAVAGAVAGAAIATMLLRLATVVIPADVLPGATTLQFDARVVGFCAAIALLVAALLGAIPAWQQARTPPAQILAVEQRSVSGRGGRVRNALVMGEVAITVALLFGAGLFLRTLLALNTVDRGYRAGDVLTLVVDPLGSRYPTAASLEGFFNALEREMAAVPGVGHVAWASALPGAGAQADEVAISVMGEATPPDSATPVAELRIVSASYFETVDLPIVAGRTFDPHDTRDRVPVCIVSEAFARRHLPGRSPLGARLAVRSTASQQAPTRTVEVVGVTRQVKMRADESDDALQVYVPMTQLISDDMYALVRPRSGRADALAPAVRAAIGRVDREQLVSVRDVVTLDQVARDTTARQRFRAHVVTTFSVLSLVLAVVGLFGMLSYAVQQRLRELGIRRALGATTDDVLRLVVRDAARVLAVGIAAGVVLSALVARAVQSLLYGVGALDPVTLGAVAAIVMCTATLALIAPLWRATRVDPIVVLRAS